MFKYFLAICTLFPLSCTSQNIALDPDKPVFFQADKMTYDKVLNRVIAEGHVEVTQGQDYLKANRLIYSYDTEHMVADGDVLVRRPDGTQFTATYADLSKDLSEGLAKQIRIRMEQETRIAAYEGYIYPDKRKVFHYGVYSPCALCKEKPSKPPLWQIKARRFIHDTAKGEIRYHHAFFEFMGAPIFYTPYFEHPDSSRERSSGFLRPDFKTSSDMGTTFYVPYYFALADDKEMLVTPIISTSERYLVRHRYRQFFKNAEIDFDSSGGYINDDKITLNPKLSMTDRKNQLGGHVMWKARWHVTDIWRISGDLQRATQKTYLKKYNFSSEDVLKSNLQAEGFWARDYVTQSAYTFQGLRTLDEPSTTPRLLPEVAYHMDRDCLDGTFKNKLYGRNFDRDQGSIHQMASNQGEWQRTDIFPIGIKTVIRPGYRFDYYDIDIKKPELNPKLKKTSTTRAFGDFALMGSYPFLGSNDYSSFVLEPIIGFVASPLQQHEDKIPNEDSQNFEFTETKFFTPNLFSGFDRVSGGQRIDYAMRFDGSVYKENMISGMVGQICQLTEPKNFPQGSGLDRKKSDVVGRVNFEPASFYKLAYRFRIDPEKKILKRSETTVSFGPPQLRFDVGHILLRGSDFEKTFHQQQQLTEAVAYKLNDYWRLTASAIHDLASEVVIKGKKKKHRILNFVSGIAYEDECFLANVQMTRHFTVNQNLPRRNEFLFTIGLKAFAQRMQQSFGTQSFTTPFKKVEQ